jgi:hypothetical protein
MTMGASSTNAIPLAPAASCANAEPLGTHKISAAAAVLAQLIKSKGSQRTPASGYGPILTSKNLRLRKNATGVMER